MIRILILVTFALFNCVHCESEYERFDRLFGRGARREALAQSNGNPRIVGGETSPQHYPYMISLQMERGGGGGGGFPFFFQQPKSNWSHFCGASVYSQNFIITAARKFIHSVS
jgi:secreted trypsin-like serine protease